MPPSSHTGTGAVAVTPHSAATTAALDVMRSGGTAADAVIAANAVLGMVLPTTCGIGGDLFAIVHSPGMAVPDVLNASGRGGSGLDATGLRADGHRAIPPYGVESVTVPGAVDGWEALRERHGRLPLNRLLEKAIRLGNDGFEAAPELAESLTRVAGSLQGQPSAAAMLPHGAPPAPGAILRRPDLAATLQAIADRGRAAFYEGPVAEAIAAATAWTITADDLGANSADWVDAAGIDVFGMRGWTVPPNSQGYLTLAACWLVEALDPIPDPDDPGFHHAVIEAYRALAWERDDLIADPDTAPWPASRLLDPSRLEARLAHMSADRVATWPRPAPAPGGTAYFCAVDGEGMAVSCIQSNFMGIGSRIGAGSTGVFLHNRGAGFNLVPGHPNEAGPGKRPLHTLSPTLWTRDGHTTLLLGTRGGHQQPQYLAQMAVAMLHGRMEPAAAQQLPRWHIEDAGEPNRSELVVEAGMPEQVVAGLRSRGHSVALGPERAVGWGPVSVIAVDGARRAAAADPRVSTATADGD